MAPRPRSSLPPPARAWYRRKPKQLRGPSVAAFFVHIAGGAATIPRGPGSRAAFREVWRGPCRESARCRVGGPVKGVLVSRKLSRGENGPQGRLLDLTAMRPGAFLALKGGVRVGVRTITTARLRPIEEALTRAPDCLGALTIRSKVGHGPAQVSRKRDTKSKKSLLKTGPAASRHRRNPPGTGGPVW